MATENLQTGLLMPLGVCVINLALTLQILEVLKEYHLCLFGVGKMVFLELFH